MFLLIKEVTLVDLPTLLYILIGEYFVVDGEWGSSARVVIDFAFAMKVIHVPVAIVS
jgi:hypothetical protein